MHFGRSSSWQRPNDAACSSRAPSVEREQPGPCGALRPEPQDRAQVAQADHDGRCGDGSEGSEEHSADVGGGGHRRGVPASHAAAAGRRAGLPEGHHPQSQPQRPAPMPPAPWNLPAAGRGDRRDAQAVQDLRDRLRPHRQLRAAPRRGQARYVPGHRSGLEVHLHRVPRQCREDGGLGVLAEGGRGLPLPDPHRAHRQRHGLRRSAQEPQRRSGAGARASRRSMSRG
jgi:hypothetical protein